MDSTRFNVTKFIGRGCYSMVYEVVSTRGDDKDKPFRVHGSPVLVLRRGSGFDLFDLRSRYGCLSEVDARFYTSEIVCGLEHLHAMRIVHLDLKPENILLSHSGHVLITDFDRSYDITRSQKPPTHYDFCGTPLFMAPEVAKGVEITTKADVWSLAVLTADIVSGLVCGVFDDLDIGINRTGAGHLRIRNFQKLSKALQSFFNACLKINCKERPNISDVKNLRFYKHVNWNESQAYRTLIYWKRPG
ncbi:Ribosomal protein S6 kinase alpha-1 [Taenia crassiceps]|uniref:Ribosomal protein S6 kinase alpha-1 n=1 Tax=Taenia crassiceps TaxID=6207 RepID=A0ABR4QTR0_9CEST